jgi:DNA-binding NarL/FixJ family response regulator
MATVKVVIADDHQGFRKALKGLIECWDGFLVVAEAGTGAEAVEQVKKHSPDIAIIDFNMPEMDGLEATREICSSCPDVPVIVISLYNPVHLADNVRESGAASYIPKSEIHARLFEVVNTVLKRRSRELTRAGVGA